MRALLVLLLLTSPALGAELTSNGASGVREVDCSYDVALDGVIARVTMRQELRATGDDTVEAVYRFALPPGAAVIGLSITPPGGKAQRGAAVDAEAAITPAVGRDVAAMVPDLGLVRWIGEGAYELLVYPVEEQRSTIVELSWVAPMTYVDGRLTLRVPSRGDKLGAISGTVTATPPPGVKKLRDLHAGGALVAAKPGKTAWPFVADGELTFDVTPVLTKAVASYATAKVDGGGGALAVTLLRPRADDSAARFARALFVVDVSSSNADATARAAMTALVDGVVDGLRDDAKVQALVFDRTVKKALTGFTAISADARAALATAIADAPGLPGTDLARALTEAHALLADLEGETLVVILTDGVLPSDADFETLDGPIGMLSDLTVSAVLLAPDALAAPDPRASVLDELASRHGGHVVATRYGEAAARAGSIAGELAAAGDWDLDPDEGLEVRGGEISIALPDRIAPGGGVIAFGWYSGDAPGGATFDTDPVRATAAKAKLSRIGALALAGGALRPGDALDPNDPTARALGVVDAITTIVVVDGTDDVAAARLALGKRGGTFARVAPAIEGTLSAPDVELAEIVDVGARYEIDTAGRIRADLIGPQLLPAAHLCFDSVRQRGASPKGTVSLEIEIARGEVIAARARSTGAPEMLTCLREAAYALVVPSYTLDDADAIYLIRYPIEFATKGTVAVGDDDGLEPIDLGDSVDSPLGGLTQRN